MFSLWALYIRTKGGDKSLELDAATEIAYEWYSPYFNDELSTSWDFSVPRTPYNEELLLSVNSNGEQYPLNDGYFEAYFQGLPWQQENEVDNGRIYVVKTTTTRISLQFKQINSVLERLTHHSCRSLRIDGIEELKFYDGHLPNGYNICEYFLAYGESVRAAGTESITPSNAIVAITLNELLNQVINFGAGLSAKRHLLSLTRDYMVVVPERHNLFNGVVRKNALIAIEYMGHGVTNVPTHKIAAQDTVGVDASSYVTLPADIMLSTLLKSILYARCGRLVVREKLTGEPVIEYISPTNTTNTQHRFGELASFEWCTMHLPKPLLSEKKNTTFFLPSSQSIDYNQPLALAFYPTSVEMREIEGIPIRFYNREHFLHFLPTIEDEATFPAPRRATLTAYRSTETTILKKKYVGIFKAQSTTELEIDWSHYSHLMLPFGETMLHFVACGEAYFYSYLENKWTWLGSTPQSTLHISKRNNVTEHDLCFEKGHLVFQQISPRINIEVSCDNAKLHLHLYNRPKGATREAFLVNEPDRNFDDPQLWIISRLPGYLWRRNQNTLNTKEGHNEGEHIPAEGGGFGGGGILSLRRVSEGSPIFSPELGHYSSHELIVPQSSEHPNKFIINYKEPNQKAIPNSQFQTYFFGKGDANIYTRPPVPTVAVAKPQDKSANKLYLRVVKLVNTFTESGNFGDNSALSIYVPNSAVALPYCSGNPTETQNTYTKAYYEQLALAIEGDLETWDEEAIFAALYEHPYPSREASQRIGQQRIKKISLVLRKHECSIKSVRVVQFNEIATDYDKKLAYDNEM